VINKEQIFDFIREVYPLHRTLNSEDTSRAYDIVRKYMPGTLEFKVLDFAPGENAWDWPVPPRFTVNKAQLSRKGGPVIVDFRNNPLHVVSYSQPFHGELSFDELDKHLHYSKRNPSAIPWVYRYYQKDWGFCLSLDQYNKMDRNARYVVDIDTQFDYSKPFQVAEAYFEINPAYDDFIVVSNICHPHQVNDSISGAACAIFIARWLVENGQKENLKKNIRFLFCPERIGSIVYLSRNPEKLKKIRSGVFTEFLGYTDTLNLQHSLFESSSIDRVAAIILGESPVEYSERSFEPWNDEGVFNCHGVRIPMIFLSRTTNKILENYHTSDDNPGNLDKPSLFESLEIVKDIVYAELRNCVPKHLIEAGPPFLSKRNLWIDWTQSDKGYAQNLLLEQLLCRIDGEKDIVKLYEEIKEIIPEMKYSDIFDVLAPLVRERLIELMPLPGAHS